MNKFYWGTATSAFQIEGSLSNDFTEWERLGKFRENGSNPLYEEGSDHWKRWKEDYDYLSKLQLNAYRFSVEWARLEPRRNQYSKSAIKQYSEMIDYLLKLDIEPFVTLHHFTHPRWFHENTPWHSKGSVKSFVEFSKIMIDLFSDRVTYWVSFNEPVVWALAAYGTAKFPPGKRDLNLVMEAIYNMLEAHVQIYDYLKTRNRNAKLGIAKHFIVFKEARKWFVLDRKITEQIDSFFNKMILNAFRENRLYHWSPALLKYDSSIKLDNKIDFWGINYYYRIYSQFRFNLKNPILLFPKEPATDMGWEIYPKGLKKIIKQVSAYGKEIFITENGIATDNEALRKKFIKKHLKIVNRLKGNHNVKGYFYWSLMDNYEWLKGKTKRFGLIKVDYEDHFKRIPKPSAYYYMRLINKYSHKKENKNIIEDYFQQIRTKE